MASPNGHATSTPLRRSQFHDGMDTSWPNAADSPSRQLLHELSLQTVDYTTHLYSKLDEEAAERERAHLAALKAAAVEHERVRRSAQRAQELAQLSIEKQKMQEEADELRALDRERQEKVEQEIMQRRQALEEAKRLAEKERIAAEAKAAAEEAEQHRRDQRAKEDEEAAKRSAAQQEQRAAEDRKETTQSQEANQQSNGTTTYQHTPSVKEPPSKPSPPVQTQSSQTAQTQTSRDADHDRYLKLHKALKGLRKDIVAHGKSNAALKSQMGDMRRQIRKSVGQLTSALEARRIPLQNIRKILSDAAQVQHPSVDISPFIVSQALPQVDAQQRQVSGLLLYLLNIFSKSVISQFINETGADPRTADPIGIVAISIFAHKEYRWQGISLIDMLIAKFHVTCPVLFGIYGNDQTEAGRKRIGWWVDPETGRWVSEQRHSERMMGLSSGFGALSLRNFQNAASANPFPPSHYWRAMASILNTPIKQITQTHCTVLTGLIEQHVTRFVSFYGSAAIAVLRRAVVELPKEVPQSAASSVLATLASTLRRDLHLTL